MMHRLRFVPLVFAATAFVVVAAASASRSGPSRASAIPLAPAFTAKQLSAHAGENWLSVQGDLENDRYSTLTQMKPSNVKKLKLAWHIHMGDCPTRNEVCSGEEANATVFKGVMYVENVHSQVFALNAATGKVLWKAKPKYVQGYSSGAGGRTPGVSLGGGLVYQTLPDGYLVAYDQGTGKVAWQTAVGNWQKGVSLAVTPAYYNGMLYLGTSGGDGGGVSSVFSAYNAATGQIVWSWSEIPTHNQPGGDTWPLSDRTGSNYGGGAIWENPLIDTADNLVMIGTGNPNPWNSRGPGENLWTDSIVALNASTGAFVWGYQISHHDEWDSDLPNNSLLVSENVGGKHVNAVVAVTKDGQTYILNAKNGKPLEPIKIQKVPQAAGSHNWPVQPIPQPPNTLPGCIGGNPTSYNGKVHCYDQLMKGGGGRVCADPGRWQGLKAPDGKPYKVSCYWEPYNTKQYVVMPFESMDWPASSYSPLTHGFITCGVTNRSFAFEQVPASSQVVSPAGGIGFGIAAVIDAQIDPKNLNDFGNFNSLDLSTVSRSSPGKDHWRQTWLAPCYSGTVNTASGLTFVGHLGKNLAKDGHGYLAAVSTSTGKELWESALMDAPAAAPPITYSVNGVQYVSEVVGGENHNDPTRPNPNKPSARARGDSIYTFKLG
jgi:quinohemoprotein ethanol dehydrogenase